MCESFVNLLVEEILFLGGDFDMILEFCDIVELWSFRLYLGTSLCIYIFLAHDMIGGDTMMYLYMFLVSHCLLIYFYEVIHDYMSLFCVM